MFRSWRRRRLGGPLLTAAIGAALLLTTAGPASATGWTVPKTLASPGTYWANNVAAENNVIVASWLEGSSHLVYRASTNNGKSFGPAVDLGEGNPGTVTVCGGMVVGVRVNTGAGTVKLDARETRPMSSWVTRTIASDRDLTLTGIGLACVGGLRVATFFDEYVNGSLHLKVAVVPVVKALDSYEFDLGNVPIYRVRGITATDTGIWIAWSIDNRIVVQRLNVGSGAQMKVTVGPRTELQPQCAAQSVSVAATGNRVYVAYDCPGKALFRASNDRGRTFGRVHVLYRSTSDPVGIYGLDSSQNVVAASIHLGPWCPGCVGSNRAVYSTDWGKTWAEGPSNTGGYMSAVALVGSGTKMWIAQAWDNRTSHETFGDPGYIKFQMGRPY